MLGETAPLKLITCRIGSLVFPVTVGQWEITGYVQTTKQAHIWGYEPNFNRKYTTLCYYAQQKLNSASFFDKILA